MLLAVREGDRWAVQACPLHGPLSSHQQDTALTVTEILACHGCLCKNVDKTGAQDKGR